MFVILLLLTGCFEPEFTGPNGMVGRVIDAEGKPVTGLRVVSEEHGDTTDLDGRFAVQYKEPSQYVHFYYDGLWMKRQWQSDGDDLRILLRLPPLQDLEMFCELPYQCNAEFHWELEGHLEATATAKCLPGIATSLVRVPMGTPKAVCRSVSGRGTEVLPRVNIEGKRLSLLAPPSELRVEVHDRNRKTPENCMVFVDGQEIQDVGGGVWMGAATGRVSIGSVCDDIPTLPQRVDVNGSTRVVLQWLGSGPMLSFGKEGAEYTTLVLQSDSPDGGWRVQLKPTKPGVFTLPPLPIGDYRLSVGDPSILSRMNAGDPLKSDVVLWSKQANGFLGTLRMSRQMAAGSIPMEGI